MSKIAYLCTDLLFTSKIRETARGLGHDAVAARDVGAFVDAAAGAALAIVDLRRPDALAAIDALRERASDVKVVGFCDHERVDLFEAARSRGAKALAKGKFSSDLALLLDASDTRPAGA